MADQQLSQYIQQQLRKGFSVSQIRTFLVGHGYNAPISPSQARQQEPTCALQEMQLVTIL